jgi:phage terminase large subunit GpA-like protein
LEKKPPESALDDFPEGYCHFPIEYSENYFRQLTAEEYIPERTRTGQIRHRWHIPHGKRNEAHDCRVYAMGALYLFASMVGEEVFPGEEFTWPKFWEWIAEYNKTKDLVRA